MQIRTVMKSAVATCLFWPVAGASGGPLPGYTQTNLVSSVPLLATSTDANLKNPWGIAFGPSTPFWVSDNASGVSSLYNSAGTPQNLVVTIPKPGGGTSAPTGIAFNGNSGVFNGDLFVFATEDGTLAGWRGALGSSAEILDISGTGAVYKGLAIGSIGSASYLYAADFHSGNITVLPSSGAPALLGNFADPNLPSGFSPFNIQNLNGQLYVTYAQKNASSDDEFAGPGLGFVDIFDLNGNLVKRLASQGALNAPWGLALAPAGFGLDPGDLLVGNFGDGLINVYDSSGALVGTIADAASNPIANSGLWGLTFGNGGNGGSPTSLYLTAGINNEADGLLARIDQVPEPTAACLFAFPAGLLLLLRRRTIAIPSL